MFDQLTYKMFNRVTFKMFNRGTCRTNRKTSRSAPSVLHPQLAKTNQTKNIRHWDVLFWIFMKMLVLLSNTDGFIYIRLHIDDTQWNERILIYLIWNVLKLSWFELWPVMENCTRRGRNLFTVSSGRGEYTTSALECISLQIICQLDLLKKRFVWLFTGGLKRF